MIVQKSLNGEVIAHTQRGPLTEPDFRTLATDFNVPSGLVSGLFRYLAYGIEPGHFLSAMIEGDLYGAANAADTHNREKLFVIARFITNVFPPGSYGSGARLTAWIKDFDKPENWSAV